MKYTRLVGTKDILPGETFQWIALQDILRDASARFGYHEIITPLIEATNLFIHSVGDVTDIVSKEMYSFKDKAERNITLKPEGTSSVVRAYLENHLTDLSKPVKLYYIDRFFRYEKPQKGRYREFHQYGAECFGSDSPAVDAEVIQLAFHLLQSMGMKDLILQLNSIGCPTCRPQYREQLVAFLSLHENKLCSECKLRALKNPLRVLDCKKECCQAVLAGVPITTNHLCPDCAQHFSTLQELLTALGLPFQCNSRLVRGFDYYNRTVFEISSTSLGSQSALLGGGRYDYLVEMLGGPPTPAVGFAMGLERAMMIIQEANSMDFIETPTSLWIANFGGITLTESLSVANQIRQAGIRVEVDLEGKGIKKSLEAALKRGIPYLLIIGEDELKTRLFTLKDLQKKDQQSLTLQEIIDTIRNIQTNPL